MRRRSLVSVAVMLTFLITPSWAAKPDPEVLKQLAAEEQFMTTLKSGKHDRWSALPDWITGVYVSPTGVAWFEAAHISGVQPDKSLMESVERAAAGTTRIIRGKIARIDRAGRFFIYGERQRLHSYDPKLKKWTSRHADGSEPPTAKNAPEPGGDTSFERENWEDSTGADWFIGGSMRGGWF